MSRNNTDSPTNFAVAYVRISVQKLQYSTSNQIDTLRKYAKRRGLKIVKIYSDERKREDFL